MNPPLSSSSPVEASQDTFRSVFQSAKAESRRTGDRRILDAVRQLFEEHLTLINTQAYRIKRHSCFICYNVMEDAVRKWVGKYLMNDLKKIGLKVWCSRELAHGDSIPKFQGKIGYADKVVLICTEEGRQKIDQRASKKELKGIAGEIQILLNSFEMGLRPDSTPRKEGTVFCIYLQKKGIEKDKACLEPTLSSGAISASLPEINRVDYYQEALQLYADMRGLDHYSQSEKIQENFIKRALDILLGRETLNREVIANWKAESQEIRNQSLSNIYEIYHPMTLLKTRLLEFYTSQETAIYEASPDVFEIRIPTQDLYAHLIFVDKSKKIETESCESNETNDHRPPINTIQNQQSPILFENIFKHEKLQNASRKQVVIIGPPGVGKTVFCEMAPIKGYEYWPEFSIIFSLKIQCLKNYPNHYSIYKILAEECKFDLDEFKDLLEYPKFRESILLILDGYDELPLDSHSQRLFQDFIIKFPHWLITSRFPVPLRQKCEYELNGFEDESITIFVENFYQGLALSNNLPEFTLEVAEQKSVDFLETLRDRQTLRDLLKIPINLALACGLFRRNESLFYDPNFSMTTLHIEITNWLFKCYQIRRMRRQPIGVNTQEPEDIYAQYNPRKFVRSLARALESIAWEATRMNTSSLHQEEIEEIFTRNRLNLRDLKDSGMLTLEHHHGQFIHSTFQLFFAAVYLAHLHLVKTDGRHLDSIKFKPRYRPILLMTAGYLSRQHNGIFALRAFFRNLLSGPQDVSKSYLFCLIAECFEECEDPTKLDDLYDDFLKQYADHIHALPSESMLFELLYRKTKLFQYLAKDHLISSKNPFKQANTIQIFRRLVSDGQQLPTTILQDLVTIGQNSTSEVVLEELVELFLEMVKVRSPLLLEIIKILQNISINKKLSIIPRIHAIMALGEIVKNENRHSLEILETFEKMVQGSTMDRESSLEVALQMKEIATIGNSHSIKALTILVLIIKNSTTYSNMTIINLSLLTSPEIRLSTKALKSLEKIIHNPEIDRSKRVEAVTQWISRIKDTPNPMLSNSEKLTAIINMLINIIEEKTDLQINHVICENLYDLARFHTFYRAMIEQRLNELLSNISFDHLESETSLKYLITELLSKIKNEIHSPNLYLCDDDGDTSFTPDPCSSSQDLFPQLSNEKTTSVTKQDEKKVSPTPLKEGDILGTISPSGKEFLLQIVKGPTSQMRGYAVIILGKIASAGGRDCSLKTIQLFNSMMDKYKEKYFRSFYTPFSQSKKRSRSQEETFGSDDDYFSKVIDALCPIANDYKLFPMNRHQTIVALGEIAAAGNCSSSIVLKSIRILLATFEFVPTNDRDTKRMIIRTFENISLLSLSKIIIDQDSFKDVRRICYLTYRTLFILGSKINLCDRDQQIEVDTPFGIDINQLQNEEIGPPSLSPNVNATVNSILLVSSKDKEKCTISADEESQRENGSTSLSELTDDSIQPSCSLDTYAMIGKVFSFKNVQYEVLNTAGGGSCGLHALLGKVINGQVSYRYCPLAAKEEFLSHLVPKKNHFSKELFDLFCSFFSETMLDTPSYEARQLMKDENLPYQINEQNTLLERLNKSKQIRANRLREYLSESNIEEPHLDHILTQLVPIEGTEPLETLRTLPGEVLTHQVNANWNDLFEHLSPQGQEKMRWDDQLVTLYQNEFDCFIPNYIEKRFFELWKNYLEVVKLPEYFLSTDELIMAAKLYRKKGVVVTLSDQKESLTVGQYVCLNMEDGEEPDVVIVHDSTASHYHQCRKIILQGEAYEL